MRAAKFRIAVAAPLPDQADRRGDLLVAVVPAKQGAQVVAPPGPRRFGSIIPCVRVNPGATALTVMQCGPYSLASARVMPISPDLLAT